MCQAMNVFSEDRYVGGIESDISTVITFQGGAGSGGNTGATGGLYGGGGGGATSTVLAGNGGAGAIVFSWG